MGKGGQITRRSLLAGLLGLAALWPLWPRAAASARAPLPVGDEPTGNGATPGAMPLSELVGERLTFDIGFWVFSRAGQVVVELAPFPGRPNLYEARMFGQTSGVIGFFTRYRKDVYRSIMELAGGRLRPLEFQEEVIIGSELRRRRTTVFNYAAGKVTRRKLAKGGAVETDELPMAAGLLYDDYLSGIYNLRSGAYGPLREGRAYTLNLPKPKGGTVRLEVASRQEAVRLLSREGCREGKAFHCRVFMDKDLLDSRSGRMGGWFSAQGVPLGGVIEDVALFGDVTGRLASRQVSRPSVSSDV